MPDDESIYPHEPDHIIALKHHGRTIADNLAYACFECNRAKGSDIASIDVDSGQLVRLFNPRTQRWRDHFRLNGPVIDALSPEGRVTISLLRMNAPARVKIRETLMAEGRYPHGRESNEML